MHAISNQVHSYGISLQNIYYRGLKHPVSSEISRKIANKIACYILGSGFFFLSFKIFFRGQTKDFNCFISPSCPEIGDVNNAIFIVLKKFIRFF